MHFWIQRPFAHEKNCCSVTQACLTLGNPKDCYTPGFPVLQYLLEFAQTHVHWVHDAIQPSHPLSLPFLPALSLPQNQALFQWVGSLIRWPKYWSFSISPSNEYSGLISFRIDWLGLLAVQGTLKSFLQHHSSKASILYCSTFFMAQLSHLYKTTGKTRALTIRTMEKNRCPIKGHLVNDCMTKPHNVTLTHLFGQVKNGRLRKVRVLGALQILSRMALAQESGFFFFSLLSVWAVGLTLSGHSCLPEAHLSCRNGIHPKNLPFL